MRGNNPIVFWRKKWRISLFMSARSPNLAPSPLLIRICPSVTCRCRSHTSFLAILKEAPSRCRLFFAWQCSAVLSKHTWLANDNLSSDMSRNLVSQNAVLRARADRVGEVWNDKKRRASTALCYPICIPQAYNTVKLSPRGWRASCRHFEVNASEDGAPCSLKCQTMDAWATWKFTGGRAQTESNRRRVRVRVGITILMLQLGEIVRWLMNELFKVVLDTHWFPVEMGVSLSTSQ